MINVDWWPWLMRKSLIFPQNVIYYLSLRDLIHILGSSVFHYPQKLWAWKEYSSAVDLEIAFLVTAEQQSARSNRDILYSVSPVNYYNDGSVSTAHTHRCNSLWRHQGPGGTDVRRHWAPECKHHTALQSVPSAASEHRRASGVSWKFWGSTGAFSHACGTHTIFIYAFHGRPAGICILHVYLFLWQLKDTIGQLSRQLLLAEMGAEERARSTGDSGLKQVRV